MTTAVAMVGDCVACDPKDPTADAAGRAVALANGRGAATAARLSEHREWWTRFWQSGSSVDLGPNQTNLEAFYYGMQYQLGSGARTGNTAPGLYGPWQTVGRHDIAAIWVTFFSSCQRYEYRGGQVEMQGFEGDYVSSDAFRFVALSISLTREASLSQTLNYNCKLMPFSICSCPSR